MPKRRGYANGIQNATLAKIDEAGEKLQNIGFSVENTGFSAWKSGGSSPERWAEWIEMKE